MVTQSRIDASLHGISDEASVPVEIQEFNDIRENRKNFLNDYTFIYFIT